MVENLDKHDIDELKEHEINVLVVKSITPLSEDLKPETVIEEYIIDNQTDCFDLHLTFWETTCKMLVALDERKLMNTSILPSLFDIK